VKFCLVFQCETLSVPVMRRVLGDTLRGLGVDEESVYDILLAATEACTNVLTHGGQQVRGYEVVTSLGAVGCQIEVADEGIGLPPYKSRTLVRAGRTRKPRKPREPAFSAGHERQTPIAQLPESGRGLAVMRACVDQVTLDSQPGRGTVVTMRKHIRWSQDAPLRQHQAASRRFTLPRPLWLGGEISWLRADRGYHVSWVARRP
jgi:serine/threonine-protein kinase RsbW